VVLYKNFALKQKPYSDLDLETIKKRANLVRNSENFCKNIQMHNLMKVKKFFLTIEKKIESIISLICL